ncbi:hypothetical protein Celaphus_00015667 [Cervus elaphus hippelaphus]|uniref:Vesicle transport protein n=1 Tax=Cervus elaphus hippelaphus TaxID=46360 RepID=A0A212C1M2_CEREH|nr:hypothetical protein Celaphus_00015667 [Cervus elaphus hippelaphus]
MASGVCLLLAALCFGLAALYAPVLLLRARKFALLWSLGSALALAGGTLLRGGAACGRLLRGEEAPSRPALLYVVALGATLYAALCLRSTLLTALGACAQVAALLAALLGVLPRGAGTALRFTLGRLGPGAALAKALPVSDSRRRKDAESGPGTPHGAGPQDGPSRGHGEPALGPAPAIQGLRPPDPR